MCTGVHQVQMLWYRWCDTTLHTHQAAPLSGCKSALCVWIEGCVYVCVCVCVRVCVSACHRPLPLMACCLVLPTPLCSSKINLLAPSHPSPLCLEDHDTRITWQHQDARWHLCIVFTYRLFFNEAINLIRNLQKSFFKFLFWQGEPQPSSEIFKINVFLLQRWTRHIPSWWLVVSHLPSFKVN